MVVKKRRAEDLLSIRTRKRRRRHSRQQRPEASRILRDIAELMRSWFYSPDHRSVSPSSSSPSPPPCSQDENSDEEGSIEPLFLNSLQSKRGSVRSPTFHSDSDESPKFTHFMRNKLFKGQPSDDDDCNEVQQHLTERVDKMGLHSRPPSLKSSQITDSSSLRIFTSESKEEYRKPRVRPHSKRHIEHNKFKNSVREGKRQALKQRLYIEKKRLVKKVSTEGIMDFPQYRRLVQTAVGEPSRQHVEYPKDSMKGVLNKARLTLNGPKPFIPFSPTDEQRKILERQKDADIEQRIRGIPDTLPQKENDEISAILRKRGVVAKMVREQVSDTDISRLYPGQWLNDEIINFYGALLLARSESNKENAPTGSKTGLLNVHYFSTFFWTKLISEGYERGRLSKWTKKVDIFSKDVILIPVNHSNAHWTAAVINVRKKRIESYDSMGMAKDVVFKHLRAYLDAEHKDKKQKPFDFTDWKNIAPEDTPQQNNGWDCGVFTCHFLEAISRGDETFRFSQKNMLYLRKRMIWEIGNAKLRGGDYK